MRNTWKAAPLDSYMILQEGFNDHHIRVVVELSGLIDDERLKRVIFATAETCPVLTAGYKVGWPWGDKWVETAGPESAELHYQAVEAGCEVEAQAEREAALAQKPDGVRGPQLAITRVRFNGRDSLVLVMNHVAMDGSGFRAYLCLLAKYYSDAGCLAQSGLVSPGKTREAITLLNQFSTRTRIHLALRKGGRPIEPVLVVPSPPSSGEEADGLQPRLFLLRARVSDLTAIGPGKAELRPTLNDSFMALVCAGLDAGVNWSSQGNGLQMAFMVDLRRYNGAGALSPFCNAASMETIDMGAPGLGLGERAAAICRATRCAKANLPGLANLARIKLAHSILPRPLYRNILRRAIASASLSTTNMGKLNSASLRFGELEVIDAYFVAALKEEPTLQFTFSTFGENLAISSYGRYSAENAARVAAIYAAMKAVISAP